MRFQDQLNTRFVRNRFLTISIFKYLGTRICISEDVVR